MLYNVGFLFWEVVAASDSSLTVLGLRGLGYKGLGLQGLGCEGLGSGLMV